MLENLKRKYSKVLERRAVRIKSKILDHSEYFEKIKTETLDPGRAVAKNELLTEQE